jgi:hypothetical protein
MLDPRWEPQFASERQDLVLKITNYLPPRFRCFGGFSWFMGPCLTITILFPAEQIKTNLLYFFENTLTEGCNPIEMSENGVALSKRILI